MASNREMRMEEKNVISVTSTMAMLLSQISGLIDSENAGIFFFLGFFTLILLLPNGVKKHLVSHKSVGGKEFFMREGHTGKWNLSD